MPNQLSRIFLDTNIYIVGAADNQSYEGLILEWLGFWQQNASGVEVVISQELLEQIARVAKRLQNKDWAGELIGRVWQNLKIHYVFLEDQALTELEKQAIIPREDISVYLTAKVGEAECFVSANHVLIRSLVKDTQEFECLTPKMFVQQYLHDSNSGGG
jgi:predicted nucleic acid-binding protein